MNYEDDSQKDQKQPDATPVEQSFHRRLKQLSRTPRTPGSPRFVKGTGLGPISVIGMPSIPPFEETPAPEPSPDLSKDQLKALLVDVLDLLADSKPPKQAPEQK